MRGGLNPTPSPSPNSDAKLVPNIHVGVIRELDVVPSDALLLILDLDRLEYVLRELLLELLISEVNAKLLETVGHEALGVFVVGSGKILEGGPWRGGGTV